MPWEKVFVHVSSFWGGANLRFCNLLGCAKGYLTLWDAENSLIVYELREMTSSDDKEEDELVFDENDLISDLLRVHVSPSQAAAFAKRCLSLANAGRTPCPFCGIPIDPTGHLCPRSNGYRR